MIISGDENSTVVDPCSDQEPPLGGPPPSCPHTVWDIGTVSITVNGFTKSASYGSASTSSSIASSLASAFNADSTSPVTASASGATVTVTAKTSGTGGNTYALSATSSTSDPTDFGGPSFFASISGATLTGGTAGSTVWDSGTVTVTIGSFTASTSYSQSGNSTATQVVSALVSTGTTGLNRSGSPVTATASGATVALTYNTVGAAGNINVSATSSSSNPTLFPSGSFSGSATLNGGQDSYSSGLAHPTPQHTVMT